ncbi:RNA-binding protein [Anaerococcus porci]|nr:RNA-binding protein [Anaerococcus porci]
MKDLHTMYLNDRSEKIKNLIIKRFAKNKAYLKTCFGDALIDSKQVYNNKKGDKVKAYIYYDINNVLRASCNLSIIEHKVYSLKCIDIDKKGAYFLFGNNIKLLMPKDQKSYKLFKDMTYPVGVMLDKDNMLILTTKIREFLSLDHNFKENDIVEGRIYSINKHIGAFVAINNQYDSLLRINELKGVHIEGELLKLRVKEVKEDGKIELTNRKRAYLEIDSDSEKILDYLYENDGLVNLGDKSSPDKIYRIFGLSKSSFKRAIGRLYKEKYIRIFSNKIELMRR